MLHRSGKSGDLSLFLVSGSFSSLSLIVAELFTYDLYSVEVNSALQKSVYSRVLLFIVMTHTKDTRYAAVTNFFYVSQKKMSLLFSAPPPLLLASGTYNLKVTPYSQSTQPLNVPWPAFPSLFCPSVFHLGYISHQILGESKHLVSLCQNSSDVCTSGGKNDITRQCGTLNSEQTTTDGSLHRP